MSFGFGFALPAIPRGLAGYDPFNQTGPTLDLSFAGAVTDLSDPNGYTLTTDFIVPQYQIAAQYSIWENGMGLVSKTFSQIITFTRASSATYFDSAGVLQTATTDAPRFDYDPSTLAAQGLLMEEARTNTATYSTEFQNAVYSTVMGADITVTDNAVISLDGTTNAATYVEGTALDRHARYQTVSGLNADGVYTVSLFVKYNSGGRGFALGFGASTSSAALSSANRGGAYWATLAAGPATSTYFNGDGSPISTNAVDVGNGWFRLSLTFTFDTTNASTSFAFGFGITSGSLAVSSTGDGSSYSIYGFQLEEGEFPTSYIPTVASTVTRAIDVAQVNTLSPWFNASEGTLYAQAEVASVVLANRLTASIARSTSTANEIQVAISRAADSRRAAIINAGTNQFSYAPISTATSSKGALAYKTDDSQAAFEGTSSPVDTSVTVPSLLTTMYLGNDDSGTQNLNGWLKRVTYYPRRLSQAELESITT